ncbi:MAG: hypothetical protein OEZ14_00340 [Acidimicrobiia bacterium]|nr:hypothetical protein [Acidimicrobiia bacterium]MDH5518956.1 hypothetical protein [Acidimicrobiia bacterium]
MTDVEATIPPNHEDGMAEADGTIDPAHRVALSYIDRSRRYYASKGYEQPYRWVTNDSAPFHKPERAVASSRLAVVTTSFPVECHDGPRPAKSVRAVAADPPPEQMYTDDLFWHKDATTTDDVESFLPLRTLAGFAAEGRLGSLNDRFFCIPTTYSQRSTRADAETIASWCDDDDVDLVLLVPL